MAGNDDGRCHVYDYPAGAERTNFLAHLTNTSVMTLAFSPDGKLLATAGHDQVIHLWDTADWHRVRSLAGHLSEVWSLQFTPDGRQLLSGQPRHDGQAVEPRLFTLHGPPMSLLSRLTSLLLTASVAWGAQAQPAAPGKPAETAVKPAMMLLLPAQTSGFAQPAEALRQGFFAASKVGHEPVTLQVVR